MSVVEEMVTAAKGWRGLARLVVMVEAEAEAAVQEVQVALGAPRRRWKRVSEALAPLADGIVGARGYDAAGELLGAWDAPGDDEPDDEPDAETDEMAAHRSHTQWCLREAAKMHEASTRLTSELVGVVIEFVRTLRETAAARQGVTAEPAEGGDEAARTLGMLLTTIMSQQNRPAAEAPAHVETTATEVPNG